METAAPSDLPAPAANPTTTDRLLRSPSWILLLSVCLLGSCYSFGVWLLGPPRVDAEELYSAREQTSASFDHAAFDALLSKHVDDQGYVDYEALADDRAQLDAYAATIADADLTALSRDELLALFMNAYNAFTLQLMLDHLPIASIRDIPDAQRWSAVRWQLGGETVSLEQLEHDYLRARFVEPRIHFAIVCASIGCPPLRREAYTADRIEAQLADQVLHTFTDANRWFSIVDLDNDPPRVAVTPLMWWYANDFAATAGSKERWVATHVPLLERRVPKFDRLSWDWAINDRTPGERADGQ